MSQAFLTELPPRPEAILKIVAQGWKTSNRLVRVAITSLEAPSAIISARRLFPDLEILINEIPDPDPRIAFEPVKVRAWTYHNTIPTRALPKPNSEFVTAVAASIALPYSLESYGEAAARLAREFSSLTPGEKLGAMVFPPPWPKGEWPWEWTFRAQVICALVFSRVEAADWHSTPEASQLYDLCVGPVDWTTTAALVALTDRARTDRQDYAQILQTMMRLLSRPMTPIWFMCAFQPIWQLLQHFPGLDTETRRQIEATVAKLEAEEDDA